MPIQLVCISCGKRLQVGDQYAGRKVSCPGCKTVLTAPGTPATASHPPPPKPAPAAAKPAPLPPPPPPPPERKPAKVEIPFTFDSPGEKDEDEDEDEPKPPPKKAGAKPAPAPKRGRRDDDDEEEEERPRRSRRPAEEETEKPGAKAWRSFGGGSALAWWGLWIEFLSLAYGLGIAAYMISGLIGANTVPAIKLDELGGPKMLVPWFAGTAIGSLLTLLGRTRMISIPPGTGAKKVFFGSWALTLIRFIAVLASAGLILMASSEWPDLSKPEGLSDPKQKDAVAHGFYAFLAFSLSTPFWILSDLSTIPGMAIVGGVIPSARLRQKAGQVTFVLQLLVLAYVLAVVSAAAGLNSVDWTSFSRGAAEAAPTPPKLQGRISGTETMPTKASDAEGPKAAIMLSAALGIIVQLAYTALFASMYGAGRRAVAEAREAEEAAEDEDI